MWVEQHPGDGITDSFVCFLLDRVSAGHSLPHSGFEVF